MVEITLICSILDWCKIKLVNCTRQIMICEPIGIVYFTLGTVILNFKYRKGHTELGGNPSVLYFTVCNKN